jgi:leucyl aminopeptidase (aminopeptidase T)
MIHIALGSGFEPDRQTLYHWDFVINSPRQKLDIFGIDKKGKEHWIIRKGKFAV